MSAAWQSLLAQARAEFHANARLRWGGLLIVVILLVYLLLVLSDVRAQMQREYVQQVQRLQKISSLAGQDEWLQRAERARVLRDGLQAQLPTVATLGLAQASVQSFARDLIASSGKPLRVQSETATEVGRGSGIWRVPVVISGALAPDAAVQLIRRIEMQPNLIVIEQAMVLNRNNGMVALTVAGFFRVEEAANAPG
ncbi:MAG: hypothetical protein COW59_08795 [Lysobacterales bacterium CG17_big_fil_post_rev_8_21_14_2_50_64_11]|nr:MAG: hypothetical protein COW59_08795 [Xanthomonadales bacterium CG17_big_fil_post_rev_8_21_14_2_50_64_11]PIX61645.1 MAG: hypothetical protein COZ47_00770 [Xanthomonadales bacterium CG_4_10_14_3_um_filter_64_11]